MSKTVSFVARDDLAEWLESRADDEMKSVSAVCQDIVAAEYRRENPAETPKPDQTGDDDAEPLQEDQRFSFGSMQEAEAVRTEFSEHVSEDDDGRLKTVTFAEGTPREVVKELERRSQH